MGSFARAVEPGRGAFRTRGAGALTALGLALSLAPSTGCLNRPIEPVEPRTTKEVVANLPVPITRLDILLTIDNSPSMADKQRILGEAVPKLVGRLVNPSCIAKDGTPSPTQPANPRDTCPDGFNREFKPIADVNIGIISSSLGDLNSNGCHQDGVKHGDDDGRLLDRTPSGGVATTYQGKHFLAWDLDHDRGGTDDPVGIGNTLTDMVKGVGQDGCGYEMQLESVYRFLVDPEPYGSLTEEGQGNFLSTNAKASIDQGVLDDRANFLRPDSLVAVLMLTDENDCSFKAEGPGFHVMQGNFYRGTAVCENDPGNACCYSCAQDPPAGCEHDPSCDADGGRRTDDAQGFYCWDQKRRYGVDFLYPTARYVNAMTQPFIDPSADDLAVTDEAKKKRNPLFDNLTSEHRSTRTPDRVFFAGIVGVPWQAIARKGEDGNPDIKLGFKSYGEMVEDKLYPQLAGDPSTYKPPTDPFMVETPNVRTDTSKIFGFSPASNNPINGFDRPNTGDQLQYACIFDLGCTGASCDGKDCTGGAAGNPLCEGTTQVRAKAFPGLRELSVLEGMKDQGIVASVCPASLDASAPDALLTYGYNPAVNAIVDQLKAKLNAQCLPTQLAADKNGQVQCLVIEARTVDDGATCDCSGLARADVTQGHEAAVAAAKADIEADPNWNCFCEITQVKDPNPLHDCETVPDDAIAQHDVNGWCYLDATTVPPIGDPALLESCNDDEKHAVRFVNKGEPADGARALITCSSE